MKKAFSGGVTLLLVFAAQVAMAVPCGYSGVLPSDQCRDGIAPADSADVLNAGSYFGAANWQMLDRIDTHTDLGDAGFWTVSGAHRGLPSGDFTLAEGIWAGYSKLAVALKGPGAYAPGATQPVNWALYDLVPGTSRYSWQYGATPDGTLRNLLWITLYGVAGQVTLVSEPATTWLLLLGLLLVVIALRPARVGTRSSYPQ
jgi:hypothetical protein